MGESSLRIAPPRAFRYFEIASVLLCVTLDARLALDVLRGYAIEPPSVAASLAALVLAFVACDLVAGLVHFVLDRFGGIEVRPE